MRKSQWKPVPGKKQSYKFCYFIEDPQEQKEQHQTSDGEQERPAMTVADLRKIFEPQKTKRPQRKNDDHGKTFEVRDQDGTGYKSHVLHSGVDQNRKVPNQEPQERSGEQGRPALTVGDLLKIYEPQKTKNDHGKTFGTEYKPPELHSGVDPKRNVPNQGTEYKPHELHSGVDPKRNVPNQGFLGNEFGTGYKSHMLHSDVDQKRNISNQVFFGNEIEKTPVKSVKGEQDIDKLQIKIDDLQKKMECSLDKTEVISATVGDLLKKIDKGENNKHDLHKHIGDLLRKLDKGEQERDDLLRKLDDFQKTFEHFH